MDAFGLSRALVALVGFICVGCGSGAGSSKVAFDLPKTKAKEILIVGCNSFPPNGSIPDDYSGYGLSAIPEVTWAGTPSATKSLIFMIEDPDAPGSKPFVHWLVTDIDPGAARLPGSGTIGLNSNGEAKYFGPKPPDSSVHHYHFELFALDTTLDPSVRDRDAVVAAMAGHVIAKGQFLGTYQKH